MLDRFRRTTARFVRSVIGSDSTVEHEPEEPQEAEVAAELVCVEEPRPVVIPLALPPELIQPKSERAAGVPTSGVKKPRRSYHKVILRPQFCDGRGRKIGLDDESFHIVRLFLTGLLIVEIVQRLYCGESTPQARSIRVKNKLRLGLNHLIEGVVRIPTGTLRTEVTGLLPPPTSAEPVKAPEIKTGDERPPTQEGEQQLTKQVSTPNSLTDGRPPRRCPRCSGTMLFEEDWHGAYSTCLSCGYVYEFGATAALELEEKIGGKHRQRRRQPSHGKLRL